MFVVMNKDKWAKLPADERKLYERMMEVFAGFVAHADHHIGRVLDHLAATGDLDNTVVVFISDNGTSGLELFRSTGTPRGTALVKDINAGPGGILPYPGGGVNPVIFKGSIWFFAINASTFSSTTTW